MPLPKFVLAYIPIPKLGLLGKLKGALGFGAKEVVEVAAKEASVGFKSFSSFKRAMGPAGPGKAWHHIVEQGGNNVTKFGANRIHNISNIIKLPHGKGSIHTKISGYYSSKQPFTNGQTVRQWLGSQSYQQQYDFGIRTLKQFGWKP